jgi:hypothetical protein
VPFLGLGVTRVRRWLLLRVWLVRGLAKVMLGLRATRRVRPARALWPGPPTKLGRSKRSVYENPVKG